MTSQKPERQPARPPSDVGAGSDCRYGAQRHWDVGRIRGVARGIPRGRSHFPLPPHLRLLVTERGEEREGG